MPVMDVTFPAGVLDTEQKDELADELTAILLRAERAPDTQFFRDVTWVYFHELPAAHVYTAGKPVEADQARFRVEVITPEGALSDRRRAEAVENMTAAVKRIAGIPDEESLRVFVMCREIAEGSWGAAGAIVQFQALREAAAAERAKAEATTA